MTNKLDDAVTYAKKTLSNTAQDTVADDIQDHIRRHKKINRELEAAEKRLDAGQGVPAKNLIKSLRRQQMKYGV